MSELIQECAAQYHFQMVEVPSSSDPAKRYSVIVGPEGDAVCQCPSFSHRGYCRHTGMAANTICRWSEADSNYCQTTSQRRHHECPVCGGPTQLVAV